MSAALKEILVYLFIVFALLKFGPCAAHFEVSVLKVVYGCLCSGCKKCCKISSRGAIHLSGSLKGVSQVMIVK